MQSQRILIPVVLILLVPFIFATEPALPPYHQFFVSGRIERPGGGTKKDFSVALFAKPSYRTPSSGFEILRGIGKQNDRPIAITDSSGSFSLVTSADFKPDSLAVGVVVPERPIAIGQKISVNQLQALPYTSIFNYVDDDPSGCNGCETTRNKTRTVTTHYTYSLTDQLIVITY